MHDTVQQAHWHEPGLGKKAGSREFLRPASPYDIFMESEGIPVFRGVGVSKVQNLPLAPWKRMGGRGCYIQLYGTEGKWGCYLVEVPGAGSLKPEKHLYEETFLVIEGRGTTEVWQDGDTKKHVFEWQAGSLFAIPINTMHQIINAASSPALLLVGTTAPNLLNLLKNPNALFSVPYRFDERFGGADQFYKPNDQYESDGARGLAMLRSNLIPDVVNCYVPLDNRRSPGFRRAETNMADNNFWCGIHQHESGRYSKAHAHPSDAMMICLQGKGYTFTWPEKYGVNPWKDGYADKVERVDYEPFGIVSAAPGGARWYHQHFACSKSPLRLAAWFGSRFSAHPPGPPGEKLIDIVGEELADGGTNIPYWMEDPFVRQEYGRMIEREGVENRMNPEWYVKGTKVDSR
jgi:quercetin dioxygenase-like cupin family protein